MADRHRIPSFQIFAAIVFLAASLSAAQEITLNGGLELSQIYKPGAWQPVRLQCRNDSDQTIEGELVLPVRDARAAAIMRTPLSVPPHSRVMTTVWGYFQSPDVGAAKRAKPAEAPPLAMAQWRGRDGKLLARTEMLGMPLTSSDDGPAGLGEFVLLVNQRPENLGDGYDAEQLLARLKKSSGIPLVVAGISADGLPRESAGMHAIKAIVLEGVDPESIDMAQRAALLEYVRGGGTMVFAAPIATVDQAGSWMQPLLPVRLIGTRVARQIEITPSGETLKFRQPLEIVEAVPAAGDVLLRDRDYVHSAVQPLGLGRIVFTSFPINALADAQPRAGRLWEQLFALREPQWEWNRSQLGEQRFGTLSGMIGRKVAPWGVAAAVVGGYLLMVVLAQGIFLGTSRPRAFAVSIVGAVLLSATLGLMGMARHSDQALQSARLTILDVSADGGGWQQESAAFVGANDPDLTLHAADERVMIRPALAEADNPPTVKQPSFTVEKADVRTERIERVWEAAGPADSKLRLSATARFGPNGVMLDVDNGLGQVLAAPLLVWNGRALAAPDAAVGRSNIGTLRVNERDDFSASSVLTSEQSKRRAQVIRASLAPPADTTEASSPQSTPMLIGWMNDSAGSGMIQPSNQSPIAAKSMCMVRTPLRIQPPEPGTTIAIPSLLVSFDSGKLPYDLAKGQSVPTQQEGQWLVRFAAPPELGQIRPTRAALEARLNLPGHALLIRKGQCPGGRPMANPAGPITAEWKSEVASKKVAIDCTPEDYDRDGGVWLLLEIRSTAPGGSTAAAAWQIKDFALAIDAQAVAPPKAIALDPPPNAISAEH